MYNFRPDGSTLQLARNASRRRVRPLNSVRKSHFVTSPAHAAFMRESADHSGCLRRAHDAGGLRPRHFPTWPQQSSLPRSRSSWSRALVSIRPTCEVQPLIREAKPDKPVPLGPSEAGELSTTIGLQAQLVTNCEAWKHFSIRPHVDKGYTRRLLRWCHAVHTPARPCNKLSQALTKAIAVGLSSSMFFGHR